MRVTVRVPATSANLGPGFDVFGLALELCNEVTVDTSAPAGVSWEGEGARELPTDGSDVVSVTIAGVAARMGLEPPPVSLHGVNRIPLARGLGSSSAAAVAGVVAASVLLDLGIHREPAGVFALAAEIEGHPDNAAPATFGGFTIALPSGEVHRLDPHPDLRPVAIVPDVELPTTAARAALPETVSMADAVANAAHAALMVQALTVDPSLLRTALRDRLHQDVRLALVPDVRDVFDELRRRFVPVCVSGAGPTVLAFALEDTPDLTHELLGVGDGWRIWPLAVRGRGFSIDA
ncbi:MAG: homoserine kinase [Actinomycetota bacterium]